MIENPWGFEEYFYDENGNLTDTIDILDSVNIERNKKNRKPLLTFVTLPESFC